MNKELLWEKFLNEIQKRVNSMVYAAWFSKTSLLDLKDKKALILVPHQIYKKHLSDSYLDLITNVLNDIVGDIDDVEFILEEELKNQVEEQAKPIEETIAKVTSPKFHHESNLKPEYTFDTFIVGESNEEAHYAALKVAESPGLIYNPLFIYGNSGLGKTHLMHAIGNYIVEHSDKKVLYVTSEQFISDFSGIARREPSGDDNYSYAEFFKDKYRNIDVLIIDDIQFLAGTNKTQQEFFHTFEDLRNDKKQIIISSDRSPNDLKLLEDRLRTRFSWGITVDIFPPDLKLRINILRKKIEGARIDKDIPDEVLEYIASHMASDVRQLEGAINRLLACSAMMGGADITLSFAADALKDSINKGTSEKNNISKIQKIVADYFQISVDDIKSKKRSSSIAFPRQIAMFLSRELLNESFQRIALEFGGKDHTTVMHACKKIKNDTFNNKNIRDTIEKIKQNIT